MTTPDEDKTPYQVLAELIYAEHPDRKEFLNNGAQLTIEAMRHAVPADLSPQDIESILSIIAAIAADLLATPVNLISEKINFIFDIHSLAAAAVVGEIDLGDTSAVKDLDTLIREAKERAEGHTEPASDDQTGLYL